MANVEHSTLTTTNLHENKGVSTATDSTVATASGGTTVWQKLTAANLTGTGNPFGGQFFQAHETKAQNSPMGSFSSGAWRTRVLNQALTNEIGASLNTSTGVITLPAGAYIMSARSPAYDVVGHQCKLFNSTTGLDIILGSSATTRGDGAPQTDSVIQGYKVTLAAPSDILLQHKCFQTKTVDGLGVASNMTTEIYAQVCIWKTA